MLRNHTKKVCFLLMLLVLLVLPMQSAEPMDAVNFTEGALLFIPANSSSVKMENFSIFQQLLMWMEDYKTFARTPIG